MIKKYFIILISFVLIYSSYTSEITQLFEKAFNYYKKGQIEEAESICEEVISKDGNFWSAYNLLGEINFSRDRLEKAEFYFNKSLQINPEQPQVYNILGVIYNETDKTEKAVELFKKGLKIAPNDFNINYNLGITYLIIKNDPYTAINFLEKALEVKGDDPRLLYISAITYLILGKTDLTLDFITKLRNSGNEVFASDIEALLRNYYDNSRIDLNQALSNYVDKKKMIEGKPEETTNKDKYSPLTFIEPIELEIKGKGKIILEGEN